MNRSSLKQIGLGIFEKYLTIWIFIFMTIGLLLGQFLPIVGTTLASLEIFGLSIPIAICLFFMMYPTLINIELEEIKKVAHNPAPVILTLISNWAIAPFIAYAFANIFLGFNSGFIAGVILLGIAPCTAMVLYWNKFACGNEAQGLVLVSINTITILFLYAPLGSFLLGISNIIVPFELILLSVLFFLALPLGIGIVTKRYIIKTKGREYFKNTVKKGLDKVAIIALLITLIVLFSLQGDIILAQPVNVALISIPIFLSYVVTFSINYGISYYLKFKYKEAVCTTIIGSSSHFELAIATAITLFGVGSDAALATVIGPLLEVPIMVGFVKIALRTRNIFSKRNINKKSLSQKIESLNTDYLNKSSKKINYIEPIRLKDYYFKYT
jgi:ACR3 family arsenite transporter